MDLPPMLDLPENIMTIVSEKYNHTKQSLQQDVDTLREWMKSQPHLPEVLDDRSLQNFLLFNKCSIEKSKQRIDMYYTVRSNIPDIYEGMNPSSANSKFFAKIHYCAILPKMTDEMYRVTAFKLDKSRIDEADPIEYVKEFLNLQEIRLKEDVMVGDVIIVDSSGVTLDYIMKVTPTKVAKVVTIYEKVFSMQIKALYFVNAPPFANIAISIIKKVMKPKIFDRIRLCDDTSILLKELPKTCLPQDYGGEASSVKELWELTQRHFERHQQRYDLLDKLRVDETLRPEKLVNDEILGFHGNFKTLSVD